MNILFICTANRDRSRTAEHIFQDLYPKFNFIKLDNGQFAAQPNNRTIFTDQSLVLGERKRPDFKVCTQNYTVENNPKWSVGHTDEWQYKTKDEEGESS